MSDSRQVQSLNCMDELSQSEQFRSARKSYLEILKTQSQSISQLRPPRSAASHDKMMAKVQQFADTRGRAMYYPFVASGLGNGPLMELSDGSVKYDLITGIGVNFLGHCHPALMEAQLDSVGCDVMQGNLQPGEESIDLVKTLVDACGPQCRLKHGWPTLSGTMANEMALKMIRQKKHPAYKVIAFEHCFSGRSATMQEITDNPKYREGQPLFDIVTHIPFYSESLGCEESIRRSSSALEELVRKNPQTYATLMVEIVQGEGGFNIAPREFWVAVFEKAHQLNLAIWADEVQTFSRTGELFAFQTFGLEKYVDMVTVGKSLQACMALYTEEYNPKPGLIAGTFSGSSASLRAANSVLRFLLQEKMLGPEGLILRNARLLTESLNRLAHGSCKAVMKPCKGIGGMIAFEVYDASMDKTKDLIMRLFHKGLMVFSCGHGPYYIRLLPPLPVLNERHIQEITQVLEETLLENRS